MSKGVQIFQKILDRGSKNNGVQILRYSMHTKWLIFKCRAQLISFLRIKPASRAPSQGNDIGDVLVISLLYLENKFTMVKLSFSTKLSPSVRDFVFNSVPAFTRAFSNVHRRQTSCMNYEIISLLRHNSYNRCSFVLYVYVWLSFVPFYQLNIR